MCVVQHEIIGAASADKLLRHTAGCSVPGEPRCSAGPSACGCGGNAYDATVSTDWTLLLLLGQQSAVAQLLSTSAAAHASRQQTAALILVRQ